MRWTLSVVGLAGLAGLSVTATAFVVARHTFAEMWSAGREAHEQGDSYVPDVGLLLLLIAAGAPVLLAVCWLGSAALQAAHARAVTGEAEPTRWRRLRLGQVVAVYLLRWLIVCAVPAVTFWLWAHLRPDTGRRTLLLDVLTGPAGLAALLLRLSLAFAPPAAASGAGPVAALRNSWRLVRRPGAWWKTLAVSASACVLTVGTFTLLFHTAGPLRGVVRSAVMAFGRIDNPYIAHAMGLLAPAAVTLLLTALATLPVVHTAVALLHERLRQGRPRRPHTRP
ncbi:hypothetical protein [Streptomyces sp. AC627_RSS907]|uniref:hypothetical protein n=1 Tax=Streptomyces sp. AC627_RSS907 TaxID=2823684 RepID=UPI001C23AE45|nr:hypothetical protein [Streptomyces sp. AC627_RSS907]